MDLEKIYHDSDGKERNILQMVRESPEWAASRIQCGELAERKLNEYRELLKLCKAFSEIGPMTGEDGGDFQKVLEYELTALENLGEK